MSLNVKLLTLGLGDEYLVQTTKALKVTHVEHGDTIVDPNAVGAFVTTGGIERRLEVDELVLPGSMISIGFTPFARGQNVTNTAGPTSDFTEEVKDAISLRIAYVEVEATWEEVLPTIDRTTDFSFEFEFPETPVHPNREGWSHEFEFTSHIEIDQIRILTQIDRVQWGGRGDCFFSLEILEVTATEEGFVHRCRMEPVPESVNNPIGSDRAIFEFLKDGWVYHRTGADYPFSVDYEATPPPPPVVVERTNGLVVEKRVGRDTEIGDIGHKKQWTTQGRYYYQRETHTTDIDNFEVSVRCDFSDDVTVWGYKTWQDYWRVTEYDNETGYHTYEDEIRLGTEYDSISPCSNTHEFINSGDLELKPRYYHYKVYTDIGVFEETVEIPAGSDLTGLGEPSWDDVDFGDPAILTGESMEFEMTFNCPKGFKSVSLSGQYTTLVETRAEIGDTTGSILVRVDIPSGLSNTIDYDYFHFDATVTDRWLSTATSEEHSYMIDTNSTIFKPEPHPQGEFELGANVQYLRANGTSNRIGSTNSRYSGANYYYKFRVPYNAPSGLSTCECSFKEVGGTGDFSSPNEHIRYIKDVPEDNMIEVFTNAVNMSPQSESITYYNSDNVRSYQNGYRFYDVPVWFKIVDNNGHTEVYKPYRFANLGTLSTDDLPSQNEE